MPRPTPHLLQPEDLGDAGRFEPLGVLDHADLAPAVNGWLRRSPAVLALYAAANAVALAVAAWAVARSGAPVLEGASRVCVGAVAAYVVLVPVHEAVHALAYRLAGARGVAVSYRWRTLTAFCAADRFVTGGAAFAGVCAAPFVVLNPALVALVAAVPPAWAPVAAGALVLHVGACSGDAGMLALLWSHRPDRVWTYDDLAAGRTYFFRAAHGPAALT